MMRAFNTWILFSKELIKHISFLLTDLLHVTTYSEPSEIFE